MHRRPGKMRGAQTEAETVRETEKENEWVNVCMCVCERARERERECAYVCVREREWAHITWAERNLAEFRETLIQISRKIVPGIVYSSQKLIWRCKYFFCICRERAWVHRREGGISIFVFQYTWWYLTLDRCPLSIFCSRGTIPGEERKSVEPTNPGSIVHEIPHGILTKSLMGYWRNPSRIIQETRLTKKERK